MHDSVNAEMAVLGSCMVDGQALLKSLAALKPGHFSHAGHQQIFEVMEEMHKSGAPVDIVTVGESLGKKDGNGAQVFEIANSVPSSLHVDHYVKIVKKSHYERIVAQCAQSVAEQPGDAERVEKLHNAIAKMQCSEQGIKTMHEVIDSYQISFDERAKGHELKVLTGIRPFDEKIGGFKKGTLVAIGGRPNAGKSSLCVRLALNALMSGKRVLYISGEMTEVDIIDKMISLMSGVPSKKIESDKIVEVQQEVIQSLAKLSDYPFYSEVTGSLNLTKIESYVNTLNPDIVFVDYLQRFVPPDHSKNRAAFYSNICHGLKNIAIDKKIVCVLASQLNREVEHRTVQHPVLADFKETGGVEEAAHMAILLDPDREQQYTPERFCPVDLRVPKNKGPMGTISLLFDKHTTNFIEDDSL